MTCEFARRTTVCCANDLIQKSVTDSWNLFARYQIEVWSCTVYLFSTVRGRICKYVCLGITYFAVSQSSFIVHISFMTCLHFRQSQLQAKYASCPVPMESSIGTRKSQAWITFIALYVLKPSVSALFSEKWNLLCRF